MLIIVRGGNVYPSQVRRALLTIPGVGVEFRIIVERDGALDVASVHVEHAAVQGGEQGGEAEKAELARKIKRTLKNDTNIAFHVEIVGHGTLARFVSKAKRVVDKRPKYRPPT